MSAWRPTPAGSRRAASELFDVACEACTSVSARPLKATLAMLGAAIGVAAFVVVTGLTSTTRAQVNARFNSLSATEVLVSDTQRAAASLAFPRDTEKLVDRIKGVVCSGVLFQANVPFTQSVMRLFPTAEPQPVNSVQVVGASPGLFQAVLATVATGRTFSPLAEQRRQDVAVLGPTAAQRLGIRDITAQPAVVINGVPFSVVGILKSIRREPSLLQAAIVPYQTALKYWGPPKEGADLIVATNPGSAAVVASQLPAAILPTDPARLAVVSSAIPFIFQSAINSDISKLLLITGLVALMLGALGITSVTMTSVLERFHEIGVRRALGATRRAIVAQFLTESTILGACGGVAGTCAAIIALVLIADANGWYAVLNPLIILPAPLIGAAVGCAAGAYPALRAAMLNPAEAVRR